MPQGAEMTTQWTGSAYPKFALWLLDEKLSPLASGHHGCARAVASVTDLFREWVSSNQKPSDERLTAAMSEAAAAASGDTGASGPPAFAVGSAYALAGMLPMQAIWSAAQAAGSAEAPDAACYHAVTSRLIAALLA